MTDLGVHDEPILAFTMVRSARSRWADPGVHDGPKSAGVVTRPAIAHEYCPAGVSGWEVTVERSTQRSPAKLDKDFQTRAKEQQSEGAVRVNAYVAVTAHRYPSRLQWAEKKAANGPWSDVRLFDADDLAAWLSTAPAVHAWFCRKLARPTGPLCDPETYRSRWGARTRPALPPALVVAGEEREKAASDLEKWLHSTPQGLLYVQAESVEEAALFVAELVCRDDTASARTLVLESRDAWDWAATAQTSAPLILVPSFDYFDPGLAWNVPAAVIVPVGPQADLRSQTRIALSRVPFKPAEKVLRDAGWTEGDAHELVAKSGAKLAALQRLCGYRKEGPAWLAATQGQERELVALLLLGRWPQLPTDGDAAVARCLGVEPRLLEELCSALLGADGQPVACAKEWAGARHWEWNSPGEAWLALGRWIAPADLKSFEEAVLAALGPDDPQYSLPREQRLYAPLLGKVPASSRELHEGMALSILWLATVDEDLEVRNGPGAGSVCAQRLVHRLLGGNWRRWSSLSELLPFLAEAAPDAFLSALDTSMNHGTDGVLHLFEEEDAGLLGGRNPHVGLLWALELLAWSEEHVNRVCRALARLASHDSPGKHKLANRPARSLANVLHPLAPQSTTTATQRVEIGVAIEGHYPEVAWKLFADALNSGGLESTFAPRLRAWKRAGTLEGAVLGDVEEQMRGWAERLVAMCGDDPHRLAALVKMTRNIPEDVATRILNRVDAIVPRRAHVDPEGQILAAVRRELAYLHEGNRARGRGRLDRLGRLCEALAPADPVDQDAWLFQTYPQIPGLRASDLGAQKEQGAVERSKAVARMSAMPDAIEILRRLCTLVPDPELLGEALAKSELSSVLVERVIATGDSSLSVPVASMILAMHADSSDRGLGWLSGVLATLADAGHIELVVRTLLRKSSDCATWDVVASLGEIVHQRYWACVRWVHDQSPSGIERAVSELLAAHRPDMVLQTAFFALESQSLSPESALRVLERLQDAWRPEMAGGMFEYQLAKVFNKADESGQESALSDLEQSFFFVLVDSEHPPRRLFDRLGSDPRLFAEMVSKVDQQDAPLADAGPDEGDPSASETHGALVYEAVLRAWDGFPGDSVADVRERERLLRDWATEVLRQTASMGAGSAGQVRVADILARPPTAEDGAWPAIAARELIESGNFPIFKRHISIEKANSRGVTHRSLLDGGNQERHLASVYSDWARVVDAKWPSTAVILRALAADLDHEGRAHDDEAASARIRHGA